jgi:hypothetical protein
MSMCLGRGSHIEGRTHDHADLHLLTPGLFLHRIVQHEVQEDLSARLEAVLFIHGYRRIVEENIHRIPGERPSPCDCH